MILRGNNSVKKIAIDQFPDFEPDLNSFKTTPKTKLTDVITVTGLILANGFLVNEKVKQIFERFNLVPNKYFPATVNYKNKSYPYYWWQVVSDLTDCIDYQISSFKVKRLFKIETDSLRFKDAKELKDKKLEIGVVRSLIPSTLALNFSFDQSVDLFIIGGFNEDIFVSEKLKRELENQNISGIEFKEPDFEIKVLFTNL